MIRSLFFACSLLLLHSCCCWSPQVDPVLTREETAYTDQETLYTNEDCLPDTPLTLADVLEIVFSRNLDLVAQEHEREVQAKLAVAEELKMLPPLTLDGIFSARNKNTASLTRILTVPTQPVIQPQLASLKETRQWDVRDTLNLIDFGLSYFKSKQEKIRVLIIDEQQERARQKLILDTITAYWKAVAAQKTMNETQALITRSEGMRALLQSQIEKRNLSEIQGLNTESRLLETEVILYQVTYQYQTSMAELAQYMGLPAGITFELADIEIDDGEIPDYTIADLEEVALLSRPELSVKDLEERIARESVRMAVLQMFPNVSMFADYDADGNPFLLFNYWMSAGIRATWNLFNIPQQWQLKDAAEEQALQAYTSRLALSVAVMSQVHMAYFGYLDALAQYRLAAQTYDVKNRLAIAAEKEKLAGEFPGTDTLVYISEAMDAKVVALRTYAALQIAIEQLDYAIGSPLLLTGLEWDFDSNQEIDRGTVVPKESEPIIEEQESCSDLAKLNS